MNLSVAGIGSYVPEGRLTNEEIIKELIDDFGYHLKKEDKEFLSYSVQRKLEFLEIETRSFCAGFPEENSISMSVEASLNALNDAEMKAKDIDLIFFTGVCNPFHEPSYAMILAKQLGISEVNCFDIGDACNGFLKAFELSELYIQTGKAKRILIVTCESTLEILNQVRENLHVKTLEDADYKMNLLFAGTGAAAMIITENLGYRQIVSYEESRSSNEWDISFFVSPQIKLPAPYFNEMEFTTWGDGRKIAAKVIRDMPDFAADFLEQQKIEQQDIDYVFCHQLGRNITYAVLKKLSLDISNVFPINTFRECGNMGSANIPVSLDLAKKRNILKPKDSILLLGSSCGITYTAVHMIW